jgi:hypothetical protein
MGNNKSMSKPAQRKMGDKKSLSTTCAVKDGQAAKVSV